MNNNMEYIGDDRTVTMERIEEILTDYYGDSDYDREAGCYANGRWLSIDNVLAEISANI